MYILKQSVTYLLKVASSNESKWNTMTKFTINICFNYSVFETYVFFDYKNILER